MPENAPSARDLERVRSGDVEALEALSCRALTLALRTARALVRDPDRAAEVAQDVAVEVLRSTAALRDPAAFDAWVHRITARSAIRSLTRGRLRAAAEGPWSAVAEEREPASTGSAPDPGRLGDREALAVAIGRLPARQRVALALRYVHDLPDREIAAAMRCREGTVHALLSRARTTLRHDRELVASVRPTSTTEDAVR